MPSILPNEFKNQTWLVNKMFTDSFEMQFVRIVTDDQKYSDPSKINHFKIELENKKIMRFSSFFVQLAALSPINGSIVRDPSRDLCIEEFSNKCSFSALT